MEGVLPVYGVLGNHKAAKRPVGERAVFKRTAPRGGGEEARVREHYQVGEAWEEGGCDMSHSGVIFMQSCGMT